MLRRRPAAVPLVTLPPETVLPLIVKVVLGLKGGELLEPCGAGVTMLVKLDPTRPGGVEVELLFWGLGLEKCAREMSSRASWLQVGIVIFFKQSMVSLPGRIYCKSDFSHGDSGFLFFVFFLPVIARVKSAQTVRSQMLRETFTCIIWRFCGETSLMQKSIVQRHH